MNSEDDEKFCPNCGQYVDLTRDGFYCEYCGYGEGPELWVEGEEYDD